MKHYVLGFIFNQNKSKVLLIRKEKPSWQAGKWNGIGGKIKAKINGIPEMPDAAMQRECSEETNCCYNWEYCLTFVCSGGTVFVYKAISDFTSLEEPENHIEYEQVEDELLKEWRLDVVNQLKMDKEVSWIIPVLLSDIQFPICVNLKDTMKQTEKSKN